MKGEDKGERIRSNGEESEIYHKLTGRHSRQLEEEIQECSKKGKATVIQWEQLEHC